MATACAWIRALPTTLVPGSPRLAALEASVERLRKLAITTQQAGEIVNESEHNSSSSSPPQRFRHQPTAGSSSSGAREALSVDLGAPLQQHDPSDSSADAEDDSCEWDCDDLSTPTLRSEWNGVAPRSPTLHTRRLAHVPFRPTVFLPSSNLRLNDWSPPSSAASDSGCTMGSSSVGRGLADSPFSFHGSPASDFEPQSKFYTAGSTPPPFTPVIPLLQQDEQREQEMPTPAPLHRSISRDSAASPSLQHLAGVTQSHLLHLACSVPSSASSTCPPSPDLGPRGYSPFSPSPVLAAVGSPSSVLAASSSSAAAAPLNPDSPTWKLSTLAHQSGMELSARRRAREALRGKESIGRLKMIGLSSRAQQAQQLGSMPTASFVAQQLLRDDGDYDSGSDASEQTPSPITTPNSLMRRQASTRTTIAHRIKPLMSSQGYLNLAFHPSANSSNASSSAASSSSLAHSEVDPEIVSSYLLHLSSHELAATLHPIRTLLPAEVTALIPPPTTGSCPAAVAALATAAVCASPLSAPIGSASSSSSALSAASSSSLSASSADASPAPPSLSFSSHIPSLSSLHLSLVWLRCIARSSWRKSVPSDLLLESFAFLEVDSVLLGVMRVSKHWRSAALELLKGDARRAEVAAKRARLHIKCKMRVYRRLTPTQMISVNAREATAAAAATAEPDDE